MQTHGGVPVFPHKTSLFSAFLFEILLENIASYFTWGCFQGMGLGLEALGKDKMSLHKKSAVKLVSVFPQ